MKTGKYKGTERSQFLMPLLNKTQVGLRKSGKSEIE